MYIPAIILVLIILFIDIRLLILGAIGLAILGAF
jgi:hypothetical protein